MTLRLLTHQDAGLAVLEPTASCVLPADRADGTDCLPRHRCTRPLRRDGDHGWCHLATGTHCPDAARRAAVRADAATVTSRMAGAAGTAVAYPRPGLASDATPRWPR